jgi:hypothetical protein
VEKIIWEDFCILWILACLFARVLLNALLVLLLLRSVAQGFLFSGLHYLIDDVRCLCPQGHRDLTAMWRFAVLFFFPGKEK